MSDARRLLGKARRRVGRALATGTDERSVTAEHWGEAARTKVEGDDTVVATHRDKARRGDKTLDQDETLTFTISGGKVTRLVEHHSAQESYDAFWS